MDVLNQIVEGLTKEEIRFFKLFAHRQQGKDERKDLTLLDHIRKDPASEKEDKIFKKLYGDADKNAFYRLRNRLVEDLNKSLALQHYDDDELLHIFHLLVIVRIYDSKQQHGLSFHFLKKAEHRAKAVENHELLDIVYGEFIRLSHELLVINPEKYIELRRVNTESLGRLRQMDDMLAVMSYRLKVTQNFGDKENSLLTLLESTTTQFMEDASIQKTARFRFKLYSMVSQLLLQRKDYGNLEIYLLQTWKEFNDDHLFNRNNHETRLQMLTYIVNSLFKNGKVQESLAYSELLHSSMLEFNQVLFERYEFFYYNALVNNYSTFDLSRAISLLQEMLKSNKQRKLPFYELFIYLNLATSYFDLKQFSQAIKNLNQLYLIDSYKKADPSLKFKIAVAELIIRYELKDVDFWNYRRDQVKREFAEELKGDAHLKEKQLISLMEKGNELPGSLKDRTLKDEVATFKNDWGDSENEDEVIKYVNYLTEKG